jgi:hypothetical protein
MAAGELDPQPGVLEGYAVRVPTDTPSRLTDMELQPVVAVV